MHWRAGIAFVLLGACGGGMAGPATPMPRNGFSPEDRVVIGDFSRVNAIASASDRVYVVYPSAIAIWHPLEQRWDVPRSPTRSGILRTVSSAVVDPLDRSLWLAAGSRWIHYDPALNRWEDGELSPPAQSVALDAASPASGAYFWSGSSWQVVSRVGGIATSAPPPRNAHNGPTLADAMRDLPQLRAMAPRIALGPAMVQGTLTAAAPDPQGQGWFLGTSSRGLVFFDRLGTDARPIPLGLPGDIVAAVVSSGDRVLVATEADAFHFASVTDLAADLGASSTAAGPNVRGTPFRTVWRILSTPRGLWLGTDAGVIHVAANNGGLTRYGVTNGLADERVTALAEYRGQVVAGTLRGLSISRGDSGFRPMVPTFASAVYSLLVAGDTLYVGTARGLFAYLPANDDLRMPEGFRLISNPLVAVLDLGMISDTLVAMTSDRLVWRDPSSGGWTEGPDLSALLGNLTALSPTADGAWVGGSRGAAFVRPASQPLRLLSVPAQLPDGVSTNGIAVDGRYLWIGTRGGLVRFALVNR